MPDTRWVADTRPDRAFLVPPPGLSVQAVKARRWRVRSEAARFLGELDAERQVAANPLGAAALAALQADHGDLPDDVDVIAMMYLLAYRARWHDDSDPFPAHLLFPLTLAQHGPNAVMALLQTVDHLPLTHIAQGPIRKLGAPRWFEHIEALRGTWLGATAPDRAAMQAAAPSLRMAPGIERALRLARAVGDRSWFDRLLPTVPDDVSLEPLLDWICEPTLVERHLGPPWHASDYASDLPHNLGIEAALPILRRLLASGHDTAKSAVWTSLRQVAWAPAARLACTLLDEPGIRDDLSAWLDAMPAIAIEALAGLHPFPLSARARLFHLVHRHPDHVPPHLDAEARHRIQQVRVPTTGASGPTALPDFLAAPPWRDPPPPPRLEPLTLTPHHLPIDLGICDDEIQRLLGEIRRDTHTLHQLTYAQHPSLLAHATDALFDDVLSQGRIDWSSGRDDVPLLLVRAPEQLLTRLLADVDEWSSEVLEILHDIGSTQQVPTLVASGRHRSRLPRLRAWFLAHPRHAAFGLLPIVLGPDRTDHELDLLRFLHAQSPGALEEALDVYGPEAREAASALLRVDPLHRLPPKRTALPRSLDRTRLPPVSLLDGSVLPDDGVTALLELCTLSTLEPPYAGFDRVRDLCTSDSLAAFAWALTLSWLADGAPGRHAWMLRALGPLGSPDVVPLLAPAIVAWPSQKLAARAQHGLAVLEGIGTDAALATLHRIARTGKTKRLKEDATLRIQAVAARRGLSDEELAERIVPTLGLDAPQSLVLDYGPRQLAIRFDESLTPMVVDDGRLKKSAPRPRKTDDADLAAAAIARFKVLKKQAKTVAAEQLQRLQSLMLGGRDIAPETFRGGYADHPLLTHLVQRLVWGRYDAHGQLELFVVSGERELLDLDDAPVDLAAGSVFLPHPVHLDDAQRRRAAQWLDDYELVQPFPQIHRPFTRPSAEERGASEVHRWRGQSAPSRAVRGLLGRGFTAEDYDGTRFATLCRDLGDGVSARLHLEPGVVQSEDHPHHASALHFTRHGRPVTVQEVASVPFSEVVTSVADRFAD